MLKNNLHFNENGTILTTIIIEVEHLMFQFQIKMYYLKWKISFLKNTEFVDIEVINDLLLFLIIVVIVYL